MPAVRYCGDNEPDRLCIIRAYLKVVMYVLGRNEKNWEKHLSEYVTSPSEFEAEIHGMCISANHTTPFGCRYTKHGI